MGDKEFVRQQGKMNRTKNKMVLSVLEKRASRYRCKDLNKVDGDNFLYQ